MRTISEDDLRAAVAAGHVSEAQAATVLALSAAREGQRQALTADDEPFELLRGFNEVFVSIGIALVAAGWIGLSLIGNVGGGMILAGAAGLAWVGAEYLTRRRRMVLPSFLLTGSTVGFALMFALLTFADTKAPGSYVASCFAFAALVGGVFYWRFRVPFAWFAIGLMVVMAVLTAVGTVNYGEFSFKLLASPSALFDFGGGAVFPIVTMALGLAGFALAMKFDLSDPHRITRRSANAFWLHVLAAPAIVNTIALSLYNSGAAFASAGLVLVILAIAVLALVIDRRSFLVSAILYVWMVSQQALDGTNGGVSGALLLLALGLLVAFLGAKWASLRGRIMRALPVFPGKSKLPPYTVSENTPALSISRNT
jgi:hypothetical protein